MTAKPALTLEVQKKIETLYGKPPRMCLQCGKLESVSHRDGYIFECGLCEQLIVHLGDGKFQKIGNTD